MLNFNNVGKSIKRIISVGYYIAVALSIAFGIVINSIIKILLSASDLSDGERSAIAFFFSLLITLASIYFAWLGRLLLYGYAEMAEASTMIQKVINKEHPDLIEPDLAEEDEPTENGGTTYSTDNEPTPPEYTGSGSDGYDTNPPIDEFPEIDIEQDNGPLRPIIISESKWKCPECSREHNNSVNVCSCGYKKVL
ncbi:MAG: hypothetical protein IKZ47_04960 [Clostridia bacterium]|nr:hypothetical protein [Clostridia bacterium]